MDAANYAEPFGLGDPFAAPPIVIAASPGFVPPADTTPLYAHEWAALLAQCRHALDRRRNAYPAMIKSGLIQPDLAARDIAAWELLVTEWQWIVYGSGRPPPLNTINDRIAAIDLAMIRVRKEIDRGNAPHDLYRQAHLIQALHWHLVHQIHGEPRVHSMARLNHRFRADEQARYCEPCDRWLGGKIPNPCTRTNCGHPERIAA
jgi:hypothetical protein